MANLCDTSIELIGSKEDIDTIEALFDRVYGGKIYGDWIGHMLTDGLGMSEEDVDRLEAAGTIVDYYRNGDVEFDIIQEDKWSPQLDPVAVLVDQLTPDVQLRYCAIEPGCGIFSTNKQELANTYLVDVNDPDEVPESMRYYDYDFVDKDVLFEHLCEWKGVKEDFSAVGLENLVDEMLKDYGDYISINRMEYEEIM